MIEQVNESLGSQSLVVAAAVFVCFSVSVCDLAQIE